MWYGTLGFIDKTNLKRDGEQHQRIQLDMFEAETPLGFLRRPTFAVLVGVTTLLATTLHGIEAAIWATAYWLLGALPDTKSAMLYSLGAMTTYGHAGIFLEARWQLMGPLEALNGMLLFGLTTAFMFAVIQKVWPWGSRERHEKTGPAP
jgi:hypothetical protein